GGRCRRRHLEPERWVKAVHLVGALIWLASSNIAQAATPAEKLMALAFRDASALADVSKSTTKARYMEQQHKVAPSKEATEALSSLTEICSFELVGDRPKNVAEMVEAVAESHSANCGAFSELASISLHIRNELEFIRTKSRPLLH